MSVNYTPEERRKFIDYIAPMIQKEAKKRGYKIVSTAIAQSIIEGACNKSELARVHHNHFGMKAGKSWLEAGRPAVNYKTGEEYNGTLVRINDWFRSYPEGDESGISGYYDFISSSRYKNLKYAQNYQEYAEFLKADGWATSSTYVKTLCDVVKANKLMRFDEVEIQYYPIVTGYSSIVEALELIGVDSSKSFRRKIWNANFTGVYLFTAKQNQMMLDRLANGLLMIP